MANTVSLIEGAQGFIQASKIIHASVAVLIEKLPLYFRQSIYPSRVDAPGITIIEIENNIGLSSYIEKEKRTRGDNELKEDIITSIETIREKLQESEYLLNTLIEKMRGKGYEKSAIMELKKCSKRFVVTGRSLDKLLLSLNSRPERLLVCELGKVKVDIDHFSTFTVNLIIETLLAQHN
jgi:hypothetical protein